MGPSRALAVTWRQVIAWLAAVVLVLVALIVVLRSDGLPATDAAASRATRWFVHQPSGRAVLVDGFGGRALASLPGGVAGDDLIVAESGNQVFLLNDTSGNLRAIDTAELRLGPENGVSALGSGRAVAQLGPSGLVVADTIDGDATFLPTGTDPVPFDFTGDVITSPGTDPDEGLAVAPDGTIWTISEGDLHRNTTAGTIVRELDLGEAVVSLVGNRPFLVDRTNRRAMLGEGRWVDIPADIDGSEFVIQRPGPRYECGWVAAGDDLWCIDENEIVETSSIEGLGASGGDQIAIAGDAAALVRRFPTSLTHFDWRTDSMIHRDPITVDPDARLAVTSTVDVIWIDDVAGDTVWTVHPWGMEAIDKADEAVLVLGEDGAIVDEGVSDDGDRLGTQEGAVEEEQEREDPRPDVDDPPVAVPDTVTARAGSSVPIAVTANDYDPDGEAIAVIDVDQPGHGSVEIGTASSVVYNPEAGYVGFDEFEYTITDGDDTASALVTVELLPADATNQPPVGAPDFARTGVDRPVIVEVLLNDIDPERDPIRIGSVAAPQDAVVTVLEEGPSGVPALRFEPPEGRDGEINFTYRPVDSFGAEGEDVEVTVEVAAFDAENQPPTTRPDALRVRRNVRTALPVLNNDDDPDGDPLFLSVVEPLPPALDVVRDGNRLQITALAGSADAIPFQYEVDDNNGHVVRGQVLVVVIDDEDPNSPPIVNADNETVVAGETILINALTNDSDPDGDPLTIIEVTQPDERRGTARIVDNQVEFAAAPLDEGDEEDAVARFTYTVDDGFGHQVTGEISITILPEPLRAPPTAQDDFVTTTVDQPVLADVLENDNDPSGGKPLLTGTPSCLAGGTGTITTDNRIRYQPPLGRIGNFTCQYEVVNRNGDGRASATLTITVEQPPDTNLAPITVDDLHTVEVGESIVVDVTENDIDPDSDFALTVTSVTQPSRGEATRSGNFIRYSGDDEIGVVVIPYVVQDIDGAEASGFMRVTIVEPEPLPPTAIDDFQTMIAGSAPPPFPVLDNDSDPDTPDGDLFISAIGSVQGAGFASVQGDVITIVPDDPNEVGTLRVQYTVSDPDGNTDSALATLLIDAPPNRSPIAADDSATIANGATGRIEVLLNDSDPDGDPLEMSIVSGASGPLGTASITDSAITFSSIAGQSGTTEVTYSISDGEFSDSAVLRVTVASCQQSSPGAPDDFLRVGYLQPATIDLNSYATNGSWTIDSAPPTYVNGVYTPPAGFNGNAVIQYTVTNECGERATGTITIDVNQAPVATPVDVSVPRGQTKNVARSELVTDTDLTPPTLSIDAAPAWASIVDNALLLAPSVDVPVGPTLMVLRARDPGGLETTIEVTVDVANNKPIANGDTVAVAGGAAEFDLVANDSDPDGVNSELKLSQVPGDLTFANGEVGSIEVQGDGRRVLIDPKAGEGQATFAYTIQDADGGQSAPATVTVAGPAANEPPTAGDQTEDVIDEGPYTFTVRVSDPDGDSTRATIFDVRDPSDIVIDWEGLDITIQVDGPGTYTIEYRVRDVGGAISGWGTITVNVVAPPTTTTTTLPPTTDPPPTDPPVTDPPPTDPPVTDPPVTDPPVTDPPVTDPPVTDPPDSSAGQTTTTVATTSATTTTVAEATADPPPSES
ncbi:MAG: Ig-like domain-containing protein [Actinomycetota bacterium]